MVKDLVKSGKELIFSRQTNILSAATIIAAMVMLSRILGLLKYRLLTDRFTVSDIGVFWAAFRLPNSIFDIIVMGALTTAFIPIFTSYIDKRKYEDANRVASTVLNLSGIFFFFLSVLLLIFADPLVRLITPGLSGSETLLVVSYTRIMLVGQTLPLILGNFFTGILQSHKRFLIPAMAPIVYNIGIIIGIVFLSPVMGLYGAVWGVVLGAVLFLLIQIPISRHLDFHYEPKIHLSHPGVIAIGKLIIPRTFGLAISQINYTATLLFSSLLTSRAITIFNFAQQLQQLPISLFGATIAQAALPTLSAENANEDRQSFTKTFSNSFLHILFLTLPAAAVLIVLRIPIVRLVYGASKFDWLATVDTGRTLAFFCLSLVSESLINLIVRGFFALKDSKTPVVLGAFTVGINIVLSIIFIPILHFPVWGLAAAAATADITYSVILILFFNHKLPFISLNHLLVPASKMLLAAGITLFSLYIPMKLLDQLVFDTTRTMPLIMLTGTASLIGLSVYLFLTWVFEIDELRVFLAMFTRSKKMLLSAEETVSDVVSEITPVTITETTQEKS